MLGYNSELWQLNTETLSAGLGMSWVAPLLALRMRATSKMKVFVAQSCLTLCDTMDYTVGQVPLSVEFSRQEH